MITIAGTLKECFSKRPRLVGLFARSIVYRAPVSLIEVKKDKFYTSARSVAVKPRRIVVIVLGAQDAKSAKTAAFRKAAQGNPSLRSIVRKGRLRGWPLGDGDIVETQLTEA